uniref:Small ribosomal subunit protein bS18m n=4 Tax=Sus scrofa TaxID=9823 RepID=A0A8D0T668_PIG
MLRRRIENFSCSWFSAFACGTFEPSARTHRGSTPEGAGPALWKTEEEGQGAMAAVVSLCSRLGRRKSTDFVNAAVCLTDPGTHAVLWRSCSQYKQVASNEDLPVPMENPYKEPLKKCILCEKHVDYKNVQLLSQFISPFTGCIYGRHITGLCGKKQKEITKAIKRAQILGFMPVTYKDPAYLKDPKVCNIKYRE